MPLYDVSYRRIQTRRTPRHRRSIALARSSASLLLARRSWVLLLAASWIPAILRAAQIYVTRQFPQAADIFLLGAFTWRDFLSQQVQFLPVVIVSLVAGAGAIASDVSSGALVLYLSKPISRIDYVVGKALPVAAGISAVTLAPALALLLLYLALAPDLELLATAPWLPLAILGYSGWLALFFSLTVLAVSSLSRSGRIAGIGFAALVFGSDLVVRAVFAHAPRFLTIRGAAMDSGYWFFGDRASGDSPLASVVAMASLMLISIIVLARRLRSQEVLS